MTNVHSIARSIDNTCEIVGGEDNLINLGLNNVMNYIEILTSINKMDVHSVATLLYQLHSKEGIYREFSLHILREGILYDGFFTFDEELNPGKDNLERIFEEMISKKPKESEDNIKKMLSEEEDKFKEIYEKNTRRIKSDINYSLKNDDMKNEYESSHNFNKMFDSKINEFKSRFDKRIISWLELNVPNMSDDDYGMLMSLIYKIKKDEGK